MVGGPWMIKRREMYYLFYTVNWFNVPEHSVKVAR